MLSEERLAEIEARAEAATAGPWEWCLGEWPCTGNMLDQGERIAALQLIQADGERWIITDGLVTVTPTPPFHELDDRDPYESDRLIVERPDAEFIAASRTDVPKMALALREARNEIERLRAIIMKYEDDRSNRFEVR